MVCAGIESPFMQRSAEQEAVTDPAPPKLGRSFQTVADYVRSEQTVRRYERRRFRCRHSGSL